MEPEQGRRQPPPKHSIAMWGAPGCGKTTFLAALDIALNRAAGSWKVVGANDASTEVLVDMSKSLVTRHRFPAATRGVENYEWYLVGETEDLVGRWWNRQAVPRSHVIRLDVLDAGGEWYAGNERAERSMVDSLVDSRGIVFLFDPTREFDKGDAYDYLHGLLAQIAQRMLAPPTSSEGRLPHHIAVCITKFDEVRVLKTADRLGLLTTDPDDALGFPRVEDDDAERLFWELCEVSASGNAGMVLSKLNKYFRPERIKFFVTSAIGFHLDPRTNGFDPDDFQNLITDGDSDKPLIRSAIYPINVIEPLLWLAQRVSADRGGEAG